MKAAAELVSMGTITVQLGERIEVGSGPKGTRLVVDVESIEVESDRVKSQPCCHGRRRLVDAE